MEIQQECDVATLLQLAESKTVMMKFGSVYRVITHQELITDVHSHAKDVELNFYVTVGGCYLWIESYAVTYTIQAPLELKEGEEE